MSMPTWVTRLVTHVHVDDAEGNRHVIGPEDEIPDWARARITNPQAWGQEPRRVPGPRVDYGAERLDPRDGLPGWLDITCGGRGQGDHPRSLIARFETVSRREVHATDASIWWEWRWTGSLAMRHPWDSAGSQDGTANVDEQVMAYLIAPDGSRQVRLRCWRHRRPLDLPLTWKHAVWRFDQLRQAGESSVSLPDLIGTITTKR